MLLSISNIKKSYITDPVLDGVSLIVEEHDKVGLIGNNGSGKTTLFNIITGEISKDDGDIFMPKDLKIGYLKQQLHIESEESIYKDCENIFVDLINMEKNLRKLEHEIADPNCKNLENLMNKYGKLQEEFQEREGYSYPSKIRGTLIGLGFKEEDFEKKVKELSGGQKSRLALAKLLLEEPDLMLLDEPTNHLDINAISWLEKYLKDFKGGLILISHDRYFLNNVVNKIALLEYHKLTIFKGNYSSYAKERKKQIELLKKQYEDQQKEIKRQEAVIERYLGLGRERFIRQGKSRQKLLDKMKKLPPPQEVKKTQIRFAPKYESGREVLKATDLEKAYDDNLIFQNINFMVYKKDKVGIIGPNGVGKSTLFKIITEKLEATSGSVEFGSNVNIAYFDQEMENLSDEKTIIDEIWDEYPTLDHFQIRRYLAQFLFVGDDIFKIIGDLSGGEKGRVSLLKIMLRGANLLLLDEPTNHLDIDSKEILEEALNIYDGTIISISHDRYFLNSTCNKIFAMSKNSIDEYLGNYDYYLEKTTITEEEDEEIISKTELDNIKKLKRQDRLKKKKEREEKEKLEKDIHNIEENIKKIDLELSSPEIYENLEKVHELSDKRDALNIELEELYEIWFSFEE
ncbi:ABC-F family ATP-binding cassette domain-containing protein [Peptoniphilus stercorisuis]|uniref:ATP-binding cassette subfamily F protein 3 n=1 Tax=Peptoniphilus stercorisuis TaxID=1436965 RepID=A0ABS4K9W9_9FIRM|nr:ABC-F family ATP-binding cassette domain-containing protein [Peptoniphilus stercorisuis]MBP2024573.1 ATP-binding cassette subfamily F protein 3 [Peptoniphilus stercorisuis]